MLFHVWIVEYAAQPPSSIRQWALQLEHFVPRASSSSASNRPSSSSTSSVILQVELRQHEPEFWSWTHPLQTRPESDPRFLGKRWAGAADADSLSRVVQVARRTNLLDGEFEIWNCQTWCVDVLDALGGEGLFSWSEGERERARRRVMYGVMSELDDFFDGR